MKIAVIGLGLIGGSFAKALCGKHEVLGFDCDIVTLKDALHEGAINAVGKDSDFSVCDMILLCVPPKGCASFVKDKISIIKKGAIICDVCGIKSELIKDVAKSLEGSGVDYVGIHPMAGKEKGGYINSDASLFAGKNLVLITDMASKKAIDAARVIANDCGFGKVVLCDAKQHDATIAYTSQLAHILSNCYLQVGKGIDTDGFTGGSFEDLTRVGIMDEKMWSQLFLAVEDKLCLLIDDITALLGDVKDKLKNKDAKALEQLLKKARDIK